MSSLSQMVNVEHIGAEKKSHQTAVQVPASYNVQYHDFSCGVLILGIQNLFIFA